MSAWPTRGDDLGLTETQIHEILPDYEPKPKTAPDKKPGDDKPT